MDKGFAELREQIALFDIRVRAMENQHAGCQPLLTSKLDAAWRKIEEHSIEIKALSEANQKLNQMVTELQHSNKILTWVGGLLGSALILWFVTQLLGMLK